MLFFHSGNIFIVDQIVNSDIEKTAETMYTSLLKQIALIFISFLAFSENYFIRFYSTAKSLFKFMKVIQRTLILEDLEFSAS